MIEPILTARQVAELFGFDRTGWVLEQADPRNADPMPSFRFGRDGKRGPVRFRASEVEAWLQRRHSAKAAK